MSDKFEMGPDEDVRPFQIVPIKKFCDLIHEIDVRLGGEKMFEPDGVVVPDIYRYRVDGRVFGIVQFLGSGAVLEWIDAVEIGDIQQPPTFWHESVKDWQDYTVREMEEAI